MTPLPIKPAPEWAAALAEGRIAVADIADPSAVHTGADGRAYVLDGNPPPTFVPLDAATWRYVCRSCGWPISLPHLSTHPTCPGDNRP